MRRILSWLLGIGVLFFAGIIAYPFLLRSQRPSRQTFHIQNTLTLSAQDKRIANVKAKTSQSVVVEGPCDGGCYGGVLDETLDGEAKEIISNLRDQKKINLIWLYQVKPTLAERHNDIFGDDTLTIKGRQTTDKKIYFTVVPAYLAAPGLQWIFVETK